MIFLPLGRSAGFRWNFATLVKKVRSCFFNFLFTLSLHSFLTNCAESCVILHEEVRKAVDSNKI